MDKIRKRNAEDLRRKWKQFLKEQKDGRSRKDSKDNRRGTDPLE